MGPLKSTFFSAFLSTFLSTLPKEYFFEYFFEHSKKYSRISSTYLLLRYKSDGWMGTGWKSLCGATIRVSLCDANKVASLEYILVFVTMIRTLLFSSSFLSKHFKKENDQFENCIVIARNTFFTFCDFLPKLP